MTEPDFSIRGQRFIDHQIVEAVKRAGPNSKEFDALREALLNYCIGTLTNLDRQGILFRELQRQCGISLAPKPRSWVEDSRRIFVLSALVAVSKFMKKYVLDGGWSPYGGSSLRSFCMRASLFEFSNEYKRHLREEQGFPLDENDNEGEEILTSLPAEGMRHDPVARVLHGEAVREALENASPGVSRMVLLTAAGWKQNEIGEYLGVTPAAVSSAVRRFRKGQPEQG